jgi:hypothetical protein
VDSGRTVVITGEDAAEVDTSDSRGRLSPQEPQAKNVVRIKNRTGADYFAALSKDFAATTPDTEQAFLDKLQASSSIQVFASSEVATSIAQVEGTPHVFFANFAGLRGGVNPVQAPQKNVRVEVAGANRAQGYFLPFLGEVSKVDGVAGNGKVTFNLPSIEKGAVFWWDTKPE